MSSLARRGAAIAALSACALAVPAAAARAQGGTEIGGTVDSMLKLSIDPPAPALATFPSHAGAPTVEIGVAVTATDAPVTLSIADGDHAAAPRRGHMVHGATILAKPLEATAGASAFGPLDSPLGPLLRGWDTELGAARTTIRLRQRVTARELRRGPFTKTVLITVASGTL